jgi:WD40 repeat protein
VLVQLFERRVLTYTPANSAEFKVEMGNVGQHYFQWRYPRLGTPWAAPEPSLPLIYASDKDTGGKHWELYTQLDGRTVRLTQEVAESVAYSYRRSWDPAQVRLLIDSRRSDNTHRQLFELDAPVVSGTDGGIVRLSYTDGKPVPPNAPYQGYLPNGAANDFNASVSPDGTKLIFVSDREGLPELYIMALNGQGGPTKLLTDGCVAQVPSWSPDGRKLYWESKCGDAQFKLVQGDIAYGDDRAYGVYASLVNVVALLPNQSGDNRFPRVSPDGTQVAFSSTRDGNSEVYLVNVDGSNLRRLTNDAGEDEAPTWNAAGTALAFASNRDGDYEIYTMRADGSDLQRVTDNSANDRWALWAQ